MKMNLARYLREFGDRSFREVPFSEVDALLFAQLSYLKMEGIVPGFEGRKGSSESDNENRKEAHEPNSESRKGFSESALQCGVTWQEMADHPDAAQLFTDPIYGRQHRRVFDLVLSSRRYRNVRVCYYVEWFNEEMQVQFSAVTFLLGETSSYVAYRGTDETIVGWKEDFNMAYMKSIPSQRRALAYLKGVGRYTKGRLILGGHSKGGNLAVYAAVKAPAELQQRIRRIYSFDGPGFRKEFYEKQGFVCVQERFCKIVPEESLVGMLFANYQQYRIVESYRSGIVQHDLMQWKIRNGRFVYRRDLDRRSRRRAAVFNAWFGSLSKNQIYIFVETLYALLCEAHVNNTYQLLKAPFGILRKVFAGFFHLDRERRGVILEMLGKLFRNIGRRSNKN